MPPKTLAKEYVMNGLCALLLSLVFASPMNVVASAPLKPEMPAANTEKLVPQNGGFLDFLTEEKDPDPVVTCISDAQKATDRCVPKYRFSDEVNERSTGKAIKWIAAANKAGANELLIEINTPGGSVPDGFELAKAIEDSEAPVTCIVDGEAASMGFYITQSCQKRVMTKRSSLMAHEPAIGGNFYGTPNQWQAIANWLAASREALAEHCQHRLKISMAEYRKRTDGGLMWWINYKEAVKVGAVDEIVDSVKNLHNRMLRK
jgi:ATP-dependent Clp protease protease subunit